MEIKQLNEENLKEVVGHLLFYWKTRGMNFSEEWASNYLVQGHKSEIMDDKFFVALVDGKVVGTMSVIIYQGDLAEMRDLYVKEEYRRKGIANGLYDTVINYCRSKEVRKVTAKIFHHLWEFFEKRGFEKEGLLKSHYKKGEDFIMISKFLKK